MKKERFDFVAMLISLFLLSAFIIEQQVRGTIGGTVLYPGNTERVRTVTEEEPMKSSIISNSLLMDAGSSFQKNDVFDLKFKDAEAKNGGKIRLEQQ
jgi:hypothetical protein